MKKIKETTMAFIAWLSKQSQKFEGEVGYISLQELGCTAEEIAASESDDATDKEMLVIVEKSFDYYMLNIHKED